jgi:hypothetical protein
MEEEPKILDNVVRNSTQTNADVNYEWIVTTAKPTLPNGRRSHDIRQQCEVISIIFWFNL